MILMMVLVLKEGGKGKMRKQNNREINFGISIMDRKKLMAFGNMEKMPENKEEKKR